MQKTTTWLATTLTALTLVGPAIAADAPTTSSTPAAEASKAAAPQTMRTRHLAAEIVSVDQGSKTVTVKHGRNAKETTFAVEGDAAARLADLKAGDHVRIGYVDNQGQMTAKTITSRNHTAKH
jgi:Cu/Ag efflux protein CusF